MSKSLLKKVSEKEMVSLDAIKYHPFNFILFNISVGEQSNSTSDHLTTFILILGFLYLNNFRLKVH